MKKFNLNTFVMKTLTSMKNGGEDEYKIMQYALKYYEKDVLTEDDMEKVQGWFENTEESDTEEDEPDKLNENSNDVTISDNNE